MPEDHPTPPRPPQLPYPYAPPNRAYAPPPRQRRPAWFWIAIIGGCFALIIPVGLILLALTIPQLLSVHKAANQTSALATMRAINSAELAYSLAYPNNRFTCSLQALGGDPRSGPPSPQAAQLIDPTLAATSQKSGYVFGISGCKGITNSSRQFYTSYHLNAVPESIGMTGSKGYCSDENNSITVDPTGGINCTEPIE
jgi:type IV pilus assembly protein PilA